MSYEALFLAPTGGAHRDGVPTFFAIRGGGDADLGVTITVKSVVANDAVEFVSFIVMKGEATRAFLAFL
jgi:hypothetical protein